MNIKRLFLTTSFTSAVLASTMVIGTSAYASPNGGKNCGAKHGGGKHAGKPTAEMMQKRLDKMSENLGLNADQQQQVQALFESKEGNREAQRAERKALHEQMRQLDPRASDYDAKLAEVANTKAALSRQRTVAKGEMRKQMAQILTPEQQAKMKAFKQQRKGGGFRHGKGKRYGEDQS